MLKPKLKSIFSEGYRKTINTKLYTSLIVSGNKHQEEIKQQTMARCQPAGKHYVATVVNCSRINDTTGKDSHLKNEREPKLSLLQEIKEQCAERTPCILGRKF